MVQYYIRFWKNCVDFSGRARRAELWYPILMNVIITSVASGVVYLLVTAGLRSVASLLLMLMQFYSLAIIVPSISLWVRRLHDINLRGWWFLLAYVPLVQVIALIWWGVKEGDRGSNNFGPDPKMQEGSYHL